MACVYEEYEVNISHEQQVQPKLKFLLVYNMKIVIEWRDETLIREWASFWLVEDSPIPPAYRPYFLS